LTGVYCWYLVLGVVMFVIPAAFEISVAQMAAFITSILFIMSPVSQLLSFFPAYNTYKIAFERVALIDEQLSSGNLHPQFEAPSKKHFESIRFEQIVYRYGLDDGSTFTLDLAELRLNKEEIVFVTGGNGSGKTTFINILTGLCKPLSGKVFINEEEVSWEEFAHFNNNMAVVFADYYPFKENYNDYDLFDTGGRCEELINRLHLRGNVELDWENRKLHTNLSRGQEKRMALLFALLEDKPILILDEWAAEQDQHNRECFYHEWIADIRRSGKTVIIISHDEAFYDAADRVVRFHYGKIMTNAEPVEN
ncbi:MAG TPA: ATP-binding cassette domain-containing protein, partial [Puia sp.]|nr:ATP-binding cassette domain-containing protein [Puia sp.]